MSENLNLPVGAMEDLEYMVKTYGMAHVVSGLAHVSRSAARNLDKLSELISDPMDKKVAKQQAKNFSLCADGAFGLERCLKYILDVS